MADLQFFATQMDHASLVSLLVTRYQAQFILDGGSLPKPPSFEKVSEIVRIIETEQNDPRFFVTSALWTVEPLIVSETKHTDGRTRFYVRQRVGGPAFDYLARRLRPESTGEQIIPSWFSDFPSYRSVNDGHAGIRRPAPMASAFKDVQCFVSRGSARSDVLETSKPGPFVLAGALEAYSRGAWLRVGEWHHTPRVKANKSFQGTRRDKAAPRP